MSQPKALRDPSLLAILGFAIIAIVGVMLRPATPIDETRYLAVAWEMWLNGDWLVPTKNFEIYTHKPPFLFWAINLVWAMTGVSETVARLVSPGFGVLTLILTRLLARTLWPDDQAVAGRAVVALAGIFAFASYGGLTMFDTALAAATVSGMVLLVRAVDTGNNWYIVGLGVILALGTLIKGPVILLHLMPALLLVPFWARGRGIRARMWLVKSVALSLVTCLAVLAFWLLPAIYFGGPEYRDAILWTQSAGRISSSFAHARPWWFFAAILPVVLFPWLLVPALWRACIRHDWRDPALRLCLVWFVAAFVLFSLISGKQAHYLIPEMPAVALVVARLAPRHFRLWLPAIPIALLSLVGIASAVGFVSLGRMATLIEPQWMLFVCALVLFAVCAAALRTGGLAGGAILTLGCMLTFNLLVGFTETGPSFDSHRIAQEIQPFEADGIAYFGQAYHAEFNFAGRLTSPVANPLSAVELDDWVKKHGEGVIVARMDRAKPEWQEFRAISYRNIPYALWRVSEAPTSKP